MYDTEAVGRRVHSSKQAKRAEKGRIHFNIFLGKDGEPTLSVDRLDEAPQKKLVSIARRAAKARKRSFYGWAELVVLSVRENGRSVIASPLPDNPYHADIVLPPDSVECRRKQMEHAQNLADNSKWLAAS
jgi:hypothetical protein